MIEIFQNNMNDLLAGREDEHHFAFALPEQDFLREVDHLATLLNNWQQIVTGQATWTYLANYRTNILMDNNMLPNRLQNN